MQAAFTLEPDELDLELLEQIKAMFHGKRIEMIVYDWDETGYLSKSPANLAHLEKAVQNIENGQNLVEADPDLFQ